MPPYLKNGGQLPQPPLLLYIIYPSAVGPVIIIMNFDVSFGCVVENALNKLLFRGYVIAMDGDYPLLIICVMTATAVVFSNTTIVNVLYNHCKLGC